MILVHPTGVIQTDMKEVICMVKLESGKSRDLVVGMTFALENVSWSETADCRR
jgi:hypothetical protein